MEKCKNCKNEKSEMKNKKLCFDCYNSKLKHCTICNKKVIGYEDHMKLHNTTKNPIKPNSLLVAFENLFSSNEIYCKYCDQNVSKSNYYFSIKKCKDCHKKYKKEKVKCDICSKLLNRAKFYKHKCS